MCNQEMLFISEKLAVNGGNGFGIGSVILPTILAS